MLSCWLNFDSSLDLAETWTTVHSQHSALIPSPTENWSSIYPASPTGVTPRNEWRRGIPPPAEVGNYPSSSSSIISNMLLRLKTHSARSWTSTVKTGRDDWSCFVLSDTQCCLRTFKTKKLTIGSNAIETKKWIHNCKWKMKCYI